MPISLRPLRWPSTPPSHDSTRSCKRLAHNVKAHAAGDVNDGARAGLAALAAATVMFAFTQPVPPAVALESTTAATPYQEAKTMILGPTADGYLRACPTNVNPNCVSTRSTNQTYSPAWRASAKMTAATATEALSAAVARLYPEATLAAAQTLDDGGSEYRAFKVKGLYGDDVLEFLIKSDGVTDRGWEGDLPGPLVTYRSLAGGVKYVWPISQPLTDFGKQRERLEALRSELGWRVLGCELIECYDNYSAW